MIRRIKRRVRDWRERRALRKLPGAKLRPDVLADAWCEMHRFLDAAVEASDEAESAGFAFHDPDPHWTDYVQHLRRLLEGPPCAELLGDPLISRSMCRGVRPGVDELALPFLGANTAFSRRTGTLARHGSTGKSARPTLRNGRADELELSLVRSAIEEGFFGSATIETAVVARVRIEHSSFGLSSSTLGHAWIAMPKPGMEAWGVGTPSQVRQGVAQKFGCMREIPVHGGKGIVLAAQR